MKKTERIGLVRRVVDDIERRKAEALAACEKSVRAAQAKLDELEAYRAVLRAGVHAPRRIRHERRRRARVPGIPEPPR